MKELENKVTTIPGEDKLPLDYKGLITVALDCPPEGSRGLKLSEQDIRSKVLDAMDGCNKEGSIMSFEDAVFDTLRHCVNEMPWPSSAEIRAFGKDVEEAFKKEIKKKNK